MMKLRDPKPNNTRTLQKLFIAIVVSMFTLQYGITLINAAAGGVASQIPQQLLLLLLNPVAYAAIAWSILDKPASRLEKLFYVVLIADATTYVYQFLAVSASYTAQLISLNLTLTKNIAFEFVIISFTMLLEVAALLVLRRRRIL